MSLKILAIGDLHIQPDNLSEINIFLSQLEKYLKTVTLDIIVILGDTLHTHETVYTECLNKMLEYVTVCERFAHTEVLVGNHEYQNNSQFLTNKHPFAGWKGRYNIVDYVKRIHMKGKNIVLCPYVPDGMFHKAISDFSGVDCVFAHQLFDGAKMGPIIAENVEKWRDDNPLLISGHIHDKQRPQPNLWYTGSSMQVSFGEQADHTISLVRITEGFPLIEEVDISPPTKKTIYVDTSNVEELDSLSLSETTRLKVSLSGDEQSFKTFKKSKQYKDLVKKGVKVVFKQKKLNDTVVKTTLKSFPDILHSIISDDMLDIYNEIVGYKTILFE